MDTPMNTLTEEAQIVIGEIDAALAEKATLAKHQTCGCIICSCEDTERCHGCGARNCGNHPVGQIPNPIYESAASRTLLLASLRMNKTVIEGLLRIELNTSTSEVDSLINREARHNLTTLINQWAGR